jgi:hypothetical protein
MVTAYWSDIWRVPRGWVSLPPGPLVRVITTPYGSELGIQLDGQKLGFFA